MDPAKYKTATTSRGLTYNYYSSPATESKPTLLFCHGFPSISSHWSRIVSFLEQQGYGIIVPDMLGYGGTEKPSDASEYSAKKLCDDLTALLDAAMGRGSKRRVIVVGHDWGSHIAGRFALWYPERLSALVL